MVYIPEWEVGSEPRTQPANLIRSETITLNSSGNTVTSTLPVSDRINALFLQISINFNITGGTCSSWVPTIRVLKNDVEVDRLTYSVDLPTIEATGTKLLYSFGTQKPDQYFGGDDIRVAIDISTGAAGSTCDFIFSITLIGSYF